MSSARTPEASDDEQDGGGPAYQSVHVSVAFCSGRRSGRTWSCSVRATQSGKHRSVNLLQICAVSGDGAAKIERLALETRRNHVLRDAHHSTIKLKILNNSFRSSVPNKTLKRTARMEERIKIPCNLSRKVQE